MRIETLFGRDSRVIQDYQWLEAYVGPLVPLEITLAFDQSSPLAYRDKLTLLWKLGERLKSRPEFAAPLSAAGCLPSLEPLRAFPAEQQAQLIEQLAAGSLASFQELGLLSRDNEAEHWRLTVKTSALGVADYGAMLADVRAMVEATIAELPPTMTVGLSTNTTGIMPLVHEIQGQLLADLLKSFAGALVLITVVMTVVQGGVLPGLLAMAPNVFPIALFFGWLGWRGDAIDIGVVMTASVALGIAVDDTLHFLTFFQRGLAQRLGRRGAVEYALGHCGQAMVQTTISCGLGLLVFALSDFLPTSRFATSMAALLVLALAGDLILLPALLLSPLGALFTKQQADPAEQSHDQQAGASPPVQQARPVYAKAG